MKQIIHVPHNTLTIPAKSVISFDKKLTRLIEEMKHALVSTKNPKGVGLAASQIGQPWRVFLTRPDANSPVGVFINPDIIRFSKEETDGVPQRENKLEGCLSIPKIWGKVKRATSVTLRYMDELGKTHEEAFSGFLATIIQHETDHTNGILFTRRVLEQQGKLYQATRDKDGKEVLEEIALK